MLDPHQICTVNANVDFLNPISTLSNGFKEVGFCMIGWLCVISLIGLWSDEMIKEFCTKTSSIQGSLCEDLDLET